MTNKHCLRACICGVVIMLMLFLLLCSYVRFILNKTLSYSTLNLSEDVRMDNCLLYHLSHLATVYCCLHDASTRDRRVSAQVQRPQKTEGLIHSLLPLQRS